MSPEHFRILSRNPGLTYDEYFNFHPQEIIMKQPLREVPVSIKNIWTDKHQFANVHKLISCIFNVMTLSFPEPTRLLVSTKTGSSGIITFPDQDFRSSSFMAHAWLGLHHGVQGLNQWGCVPQRNSICTGKARKVEFCVYKFSWSFLLHIHLKFLLIEPHLFWFVYKQFYFR